MSSESSTSCRVGEAPEAPPGASAGRRLVHRAGRILRIVIVCASAMASAGCASATRRADLLAQRLGLRHEIVAGQPFRHVVYRTVAASDRPGAAADLHVYLEGDGAAYRTRSIPSEDPTPAEPLMLRLMALDPAGAVFVGRPCYFGLSRDPGCDATRWTLARYAPEIVASLQAVIAAEAARAGARSITLIGHSGGGTLALLLANRMPQVRAVVTLAGNLDTRAWTGRHGYSPLIGSLDPSTESPRPAVLRVHYVGSADRNMPAELVAEAARHVGGEVRVVEGYTHRCCWTERWQEILADVAAARMAEPRRR